MMRGAVVVVLLVALLRASSAQGQLFTEWRPFLNCGDAAGNVAFTTPQNAAGFADGQFTALNIRGIENGKLRCYNPNTSVGSVPSGNMITSIQVSQTQEINNDCRTETVRLFNCTGSEAGCSQFISPVNFFWSSTNLTHPPTSSLWGWTQAQFTPQIYDSNDFSVTLTVVEQAGSPGTYINCRVDTLLTRVSYAPVPSTTATTTATTTASAITTTATVSGGSSTTVSATVSTTTATTTATGASTTVGVSATSSATATAASGSPTATSSAAASTATPGDAAQETSSAGGDDGTTTYIIIGCVVGGVLLLCLLVVGCFLYQRNKKDDGDADDKKEASEHGDTASDDDKIEIYGSVKGVNADGSDSVSGDSSSSEVIYAKGGLASFKGDDSKEEWF